MDKPTHYQTLGIDPSATTEQIRAAYRRLAKQHHPDTGAPAGHQRMVSLNEAYEVLSEPERRRSYDRLLARDSERGVTATQTVPRAPAGRGVSEDNERLSWLKEIYQPVSAAIQKVVRPFERQLDELSYDPYDDELIGQFEAYLQRSQQYYQQARTLFASRPNPAGAALVAELLFHGLNQLGDALDELRYFTQNYDYQHLHVGQELMSIAWDLRGQAVKAAERLLRTAAF
ncbi:J domain-containing protein [Gloeobacter kilaueensis]|uniref:Chaperone protein DnaJ n=1 Tax=Gloeobacter kilaueensis (strain ATCC BAA-2537 / CCAP 1431/1 / ULC 316 / JS1) TaxID=1183438 RepID=U5QJB3_GLOK1|nr:J domain-containing protein [Gloeobacter kilaueensis]AGY58953.1 chaperone protein DnaJ [Gloeobacter kilaueensis JS1]